jgi:hypothetical protein
MRRLAKAESLDPAAHVAGRQSRVSVAILGDRGQAKRQLKLLFQFDLRG